MPTPGKKSRRHTRTRRPYERRRRTRRAPKFTENHNRHSQHGGQRDVGEAALYDWLQAAQTIYTTAATPSTTFASLQKPELALTTGTGPTLPNYYPNYLGDIVTNIAVGIGAELGLGDQRIDSVSTFISVANALKSKDQEMFQMLGHLEDDLRQLYTTHILRTRDDTPTFTADMLLNPTSDRTPFLMIAYANLPTGIPLEPRAPVLGDVKDLPPKATISPIPAQQQQPPLQPDRLP